MKKHKTKFNAFPDWEKKKKEKRKKEKTHKKISSTW